MKTVLPGGYFGGVRDEIRKGYVNNVLPFLTAEWNHNRYYNTIVDNTPSEDDEGYDIEMFPIESIVLPNRPTSGIVKAFVGQAYVAQNHYTTVPSARYYTASPDSQYKYWVSPEMSSAVAPWNITKCAPQVAYWNEEEDEAIQVTANKIVVGFENTYAYPDAYTIQIKEDPADSWTTISTNEAVPANGRVVLYHQGEGVWLSERMVKGNTVDIHAVRIVVTSMAKTGGGSFAGSRLSLIELGARLELDISEDLVTVNDAATMAEGDLLTPLGTISANTGSITLQNEHGLYSNNNPGSILEGLLDQNVEFNLVYSYADGDVQQFHLYSDEWQESEDQTTITLFDQSKQLMEVTPAPVLYRDMSVQEIIWRLCDLVGFNNYEIVSKTEEPNSIVDIFWTSGDMNLWEVFQELSRGTQTAIFFDGYGTLQVRTREAAFDAEQEPVWTLRQFKEDAELPDIISVSETTTYEANKVTVNYQPTGFSEKVGNIIPFEVVWEPEGTVVLRASELTKNLLIGDMTLSLKLADAKIWPWKGMAQIEGEWIAYEGKRYSYYDGNVKDVATVKSLAEQKQLDALSDDDKRHLNTYTGNLVITERGLYNTEEVNHYVEANGYTTRRIDAFNTPGSSPAKGFKHNKANSTVTLENNNKQNWNDFFYAYQGNAVDVGYTRLGTRMKIDNTAHKDKIGGIFFNGDAIGAGYFVEIIATSKLDAKMRAVRNELVVYSMKPDGSIKVFGGEEVVSKDDSEKSAKNSKKKVDIGAAVAVVSGRWCEIDVYYFPGTTDVIQVWFNGQLAIEANITGTWKHSNVSRFGMFTRGHSSVTYDYLYAIANDQILYSNAQDYYDRIEGGYFANQYMRDYVYETRKVRRKVKKKWKKIQQRYKQRFFDEFGPIAHEIREFDIKFDTGGLPVLQSKLFHTNETQAVCTEYVSDISGARFTMGNTSRDNAVLNGDDSLTAMGEGTIGQKLFVYGRPVIQKDTEKITRTDDWSVRRRGPIELEYDSKWIQNKDAAEALCDWMVENWTRSESTLDVEIFGNPLLEVGDVVSIQYKDMDPDTHHYYIISVNTAFEKGITTSLGLRRLTNV